MRAHKFSDRPFVSSGLGVSVARRVSRMDIAWRDIIKLWVALGTVALPPKR
jgi:hypothetical protein